MSKAPTRYVKTKKEKLKFGGKNYRLLDVADDKQLAKQAARSYRREGFYVCIVKRTASNMKNKPIWAYALFGRSKK